MLKEINRLTKHHFWKFISVIIALIVLISLVGAQNIFRIMNGENPWSEDEPKPGETSADSTLIVTPEKDRTDLKTLISIAKEKKSELQKSLERVKDSREEKTIKRNIKLLEHEINRLQFIYKKQTGH